MAVITKSMFQANLNRTLDINASEAKLRAAGASDADISQLKGMADASGVIKVTQERLDSIWKIIDDHEINGSGSSIGYADRDSTALPLYNAVVENFQGPMQTRIEALTPERPPVAAGSLVDITARDCLNGKFRNTISLTIDDGPDPVHTANQLDIYKQRGVPATFFWTGEHMRAYPKLVERALLEGHTIGCHTYRHTILAKLERQAGRNVWVPRVSDETLIKELEDTQGVLDRIVAGSAKLQEKFPEGYQMTLFRPPGLAITEHQKEIIHQRGMAIIMVGPDSMDWKYPNDTARKIEEVVSRCTNGGTTLKTGGPALYHDVLRDNTGLATGIIDYCEGNRVAIVSIEEMMAMKAGPANVA